MTKERPLEKCSTLLLLNCYRGLHRLRIKELWADIFCGNENNACAVGVAVIHSRHKGPISLMRDYFDVKRVMTIKGWDDLVHFNDKGFNTLDERENRYKRVLAGVKKELLARGVVLPVKKHE